MCSADTEGCRYDYVRGPLITDIYIGIPQYDIGHSNFTLPIENVSAGMILGGL